MNNTVLERIMDDLYATLQGITTANGYSYDYPGGVHRFEGAPESSAEWPYISVYFGGEEKVPESNEAYMVTLIVVIDVWTQRRAGIGDSMEEVLSRHLTDVEHAVIQDGERGGNAVDTDLTGSFVEYPEAGESWTVVRSTIEVLYKHAITDLTIAQ